MNKAALIEALASKANLTKKQAEEVLGNMLELITDSLKKGEEVNLYGLGTFKVAKRAAREGRNPKTGEKLKIPASRRVNFKVSRTLKQAVN